jgi:hypothetical protein
MSDWRGKFVERLSPGGFSGATLGDWLRVLCENRFAVDPRFWFRAALITGNSALNSLVARLEQWKYGAAVAATPVPPPLFVLGIWRSGTTHLHNLLSKDRRFAFPNTYEAFYPHTFLTTAATGSRFMQWMMPATRPMDNVRSGVEEPQEDEFALVASGLSFMLGTVVFPRSERLYERYLTLRDAAPHEVARWKRALMRFVQKLTYKYQRPLILKSPAHTGRLKVLLEMFPTAKFVHIHRDPYVVFQSSLHTWRKVQGFWGLQDYEPLEERVLADYIEIYEQFFEHRGRLTAGSFCEIRFDDLERDPIGQMQRIYESLGLPDFEELRPALSAYVQSLAGYQRNSFPAMAGETKRRVARSWRRSFEEFGYAI